ncbi:MAG: NDP-sugar synthase [Nitrososphaerales archaeon]
MRIEDLRCFIPVGGKALRLRPLTQDVSKPCIRFLNRPLIEFAMITLAEQGVRNFIFGENGYINYINLFDQYGEGVGFSAKYKIEPRVHIKHQPNLDDLGSADSYRLNMEYYDVKDPVIVVQGDNIFKIDLNDFLKKHEERGAMMSIALFRVENVKDYGVAELGQDMRIKRFVEKPSPDKAPSNYVNAGIYLLSPEIRKEVESEDVMKIREQRGRLDFGYDFIPYLVNKGIPVYGYELQIWYDLGTPESYLKAMKDVLYGVLDIRVTEERLFQDKNVWVQGYSKESVKRREEILRKCKENKLYIEGAALIGRHTRIGDYTRIIDSNIDNFCIIGEKVNIKNSAIMDACRIGDCAQISDSIVGRKVVIESTCQNPTYISSMSVIGNAVHIKEGCKLIRTKVNPGLIIPPRMTYIDKFLQSYEDIVRLAEPTISF